MNIWQNPVFPTTLLIPSLGSRWTDRWGTAGRTEPFAPVPRGFHLPRWGEGSHCTSCHLSSAGDTWRFCDLQQFTSRKLLKIRLGFLWLKTRKLTLADLWEKKPTFFKRSRLAHRNEEKVNNQILDRMRFKKLQEYKRQKWMAFISGERSISQARDVHHSLHFCFILFNCAWHSELPKTLWEQDLE